MGFLRLRFRHEFHHSGQRGIIRAFRHSQLDAATLVDRACEQLAARVFRDRHRLAGQRGFIDMRLALGKLAVHRDLAAGFHHHGLADLQILDRHLDHRAAAFHRGGIGPQLQQGLDRAVGALHGVALEDVGKAEQEQQQRALEGCAHKRRPERGEHHQHIHIEHLFPQRRDGRLHSLLSGEKIGSEIQAVRQPADTGNLLHRECRDQEKQPEAA